jgi:hypothetical protein
VSALPVIARAWLAAGSPFRNPPAENAFETGDEVGIAQRPACAFGGTKSGETRIVFFSQQCRNIGNTRKHGPHFHQAARTLDHGQSSGLPTSFARTGFSPTAAL